jgi:hypothetical protein
MSPKWLSDIFNPPSSIPPRARVELAAQKTQYALGEQIKGFIKIMSDEEFLVNQAFVCLSCLTLNRIKKEIGNSKNYGSRKERGNIA